ncbi:MAG: ATP-binding cassette domain-containing protein [Euryarchaeota archaeon]|nr:ATP-binding cassette domain-containing protein [Euryarchaeota archaeon]
MTDALLNLNSVTVRRGMKTVLSQLNLQVSSGQVILFNGTNGEGKSTIIEAAAGLIPLEAGSVHHHGELLIDESGKGAKPVHPFGLTLQADGCMGHQRIEEHLVNTMDIAGSRVEMDSILERYNLKHRKHDLIAQLSGGQRRKVAMIAGILPGFISKEPRLIFLDEPDSGLDEASRISLIEDIRYLRQKGHAVLIASHNKEFEDCATDLYNIEGMVEINQEPTAEIVRDDVTNLPPKGWIALRNGVVSNNRTLSTLAYNGIAGFLTLGILLALVDPTKLDTGTIQKSGLILSSAFAAGLVGDSMVQMLHEHRSLAWWKAHKQGIPSSYIHGAILGFALTLLTQLAMDLTISWELTIIGSLLTTLTMFIVRMFDLTSARLARPRAAFTRILTPTLILPFALLVQWITDSNLI